MYSQQHEPLDLSGQQQISTPSTIRKTRPMRSFFVAISLAIGLGILALLILNAPTGKAHGETTIIIREGTTVQEIATTLEKASLIRSPMFFGIIARVRKLDRSIISGTYRFDPEDTTLAILEKISNGSYGITTVKITIPEGLTRAEMSKIFMRELANFSEEEFMSETKNEEGYLFPDTYFFYSIATTSQIVTALRENFATRTAPLQQIAKSQGKDMHEVLTMASIIEEEGVTPEDRRLISGILWKRLELRMPLQVDATFQYINGKASLELSLDDLAIDSPYNTYKYRGLPPGPITNTGLDAIEAALNPTPSPYLFYLSDDKQVIHYAKNFEEHKKNKALYIR